MNRWTMSSKMRMAILDCKGNISNYSEADVQGDWEPLLKPSVNDIGKTVTTNEGVTGTIMGCEMGTMEDIENFNFEADPGK